MEHAALIGPDAAGPLEEALLLRRRAASLGRVLCLIGAAVGALGLLGWIMGVSFLTTLVPGQPRDEGEYGAVSSLARRGGDPAPPGNGPPRGARLGERDSADSHWLIGLGTTVEYATGRDLGIDRLLFEAGR